MSYTEMSIVNAANMLWKIYPNWCEDFDYVAMARDGSGRHWGYFDKDVKESPKNHITFSRKDFYSLMLVLGKKYNNFSPAIKSQYEYINWTLEEFYCFLAGGAVNRDLYAGLGQAHGDKCDQYKDYWESYGVPYYHGCVLYMLTYTPFMNRPKPQSKEFVVDMYIRHRAWFIKKDNILNETLEGL